MASDLNKCCAFTGHRPHKLPWKRNEEDPRCVALKAELARQIGSLAAEGVTDFYTGMALGVDTWAALAVLDLRERDPAVRLHCLLPCEGQEAEWPEAAQARYRHILDRADSVTYVKRRNDKTCMLERDRRLVDASGILLAVYNGERRGGTAATVRYARKAGREVIIIDPVTLRTARGESPPDTSQPDPGVIEAGSQTYNRATAFKVKICQ